MKFCNHCGKKVRERAKVCSQCGKQLTEENKVENAENDQKKVTELDDLPTTKDSNGKPNHLEDGLNDNLGNSQSTSSLKPNRMKKQSNLIFIGVGLILFILVSYIILNKVNSPSHLIKEFEDAVKNENINTLSSILTTENKDIQLDDKAIHALIKLYNSKPLELKNAVADLNYQAEGVKTKYNTLPVELIKDGKKMLLFDDYKINILPIYINVSTNYENTDILVNGEKFTTTEETYFNDEIGPITPGIHEVKAVYDTGFFHLDKEKEVEVVSPSQTDLVDLHLDGEQVSFDLMSNRYNQLDSVKLYINGKETEYDLIEESEVGPLLTDGTMHAAFEADFPWGPMKTDEIVIDDTSMTFNFGNNEPFRQEIMDLIIKFNKEFMENYTSKKPEGFTTTSKSLEEMILEEAKLNKEDDMIFKGMFHGVDFYIDSFELKQTYDELWEVKVDTITYYEQDMYPAGDKDNLEQVEEEIRYEAIFDPEPGQWIIEDLSYPEAMDKEKMERYKEENPDIYISEWDKKKE